MENKISGLNVIQNINIEEKAKAFDKISEMFYNGNFGSASKAEIELLMFSIYMDILIENNKAENNVLNYNACSDYKIGKSLGIPQEKVRNLKVKKQARYPQEFNWYESFVAIKNRIIYDETKRKVIIPIPDPNLYNEIRNFIEENNGYIEIQRGNNCIQIRPEFLFILLYQGIDVKNVKNPEKEKEKIKKEFFKKLKEKNEKLSIEDIKTDKELSEQALELGDTAFNFLIEVLEGFSNPLIGIMKSIKVINKVAKNNL